MPSEETSFKNLQVHVFTMAEDRLLFMGGYYDSTASVDFQWNEPIDIFLHSGLQPLLCIICDSSHYINYLAVGHRGYSGGTALTQIKLTFPQQVNVPRPLEAVLDNVDSAFRKKAKSVLSNGGILPLKTSHALLR